MSSRRYYVYIMTNRYNTVLYAGVTNDLQRRVFEHQHKLVPGFTSRYGIDKLVYFAETDDVEAAIAEEKRLKGGSRKKKIALIERENPDWKDLSESWK